MKYEIGDRIGAYISGGSSAGYVLLGYGTYQGDHVPPDLPQIGPNPKLVLDDGSTHWGYQCWWGPEIQIQAKLMGQKVHKV